MKGIRPFLVFGWLAVGLLWIAQAELTGIAPCFLADFEEVEGDLPTHAGLTPLRQGTQVGGWTVHTRGGSQIKRNEVGPDSRTYARFRGASDVFYSMEAEFSEPANPADGVTIEFDVRVLRSGTVDEWRNFVFLKNDAGQTLLHLSISGHQNAYSRLSAWNAASGTWQTLTDDLQPASDDAPHPVDGWDRVRIAMEGEAFEVWIDRQSNGEWALVTPEPLPIAHPGTEATSILFEAGDPGAQTRYDRIAVTQPFELFDWSLAEERFPDVRYHYFQTGDPRPLQIHVVRADLGNPDIRLHTTPRHANWGDPAPSYSQYTIRTGRQRTRDYVTGQRNAGRNMVAAVNGAPWRPWEELSSWDKIFYDYADALGLTVSEGELVCPASQRPTLVFYKDWTVGIEFSPEDADLEMILTAVSGFGVALRDGGMVGTWMDLEPRTGVGVCAEGRHLIMMVIDGRKDHISEGASVPEVGMFLRFFGAWDGINMDGGGSTTMALLNPDASQVSVVNDPATTFLEGSARTVGNNIGIYYISEPEPVAYSDWMRYRRVPESLRGESDDAAGDGLENLWAYAFNVHPIEGLQEGDLHANPRFGTRRAVDGTPSLTVAYRKNRHATGLQIEVQTTGDLKAGTWQVPGQLLEEVLDPDPLTGDPRFEIEVEDEGSNALFMRLRAVLDES